MATRGALVCSLLALVVYVSTLSPTVAGGDSGELIAAAHDRGVIHPPGYPLYAVLAHLFTLLPVAGVAWRVNLFSAVCDAAAAGLLFRAAARWTGDPWAGLLAAGLFAFSPLVWPYAVTAEVFALNNLFVAGLLALSVDAALERSGAARRLPLAAFLVGLGLSNHHTLVFLASPFLAFVAWRERARLSAPRAWLVAALAGAAGMLPYLYLPLAARGVPAILWGDPTSLDGFLTHLLRREYGTFQLASEGMGERGQAVARVFGFASRFNASAFGMGLPLLAAALLALRRGAPARGLTALWLGALVGYVALFARLANVRLADPLHVTVQDRFWQQALVVAAALAGLGFHELARALPRDLARWAKPALAGAAVVAMVVTRAPAMDHSRRLFLRDYGAAILAGMPERAILLITSDEAVGAVRYLQVVEGVRPDVRVIPSGQLASPWFRRFAERRLPGVALPAGAFSAREFIDANAASEILLVNRIPWLETLEQAYALWPFGLAERVLPKRTTPQLAQWVNALEASLDRFDPGAGMRFAEGSWERYAATNAWGQYGRLAEALPLAAASRPEEAAPLVVRALEPLAERLPDPDPVLFKNLGVAYQYLVPRDPAARAGMTRHWRRYLELAPPGDPDLPAIRALLAHANGGR